MSETFSSTTLTDSRFIGQKVLQQVNELGTLCVYVTFVDELASLNDDRELYDVCLVLRKRGRGAGKDVEAGGKLPLMMTGANQGGKSTLLRALGLAQLMLQSGMFVPALSFRANVCDGVFTRFKREEDATMTSEDGRAGKGRVRHAPLRVGSTPLDRTVSSLPVPTC
ncbi:MAG TPA: hypothetical protein VL984_09285 [Acidimicrobiales bacterium]|nr:hypothetical protein [Acidimicrobiales bacterium]